MSRRWTRSSSVADGLMPWALRQPAAAVARAAASGRYAQSPARAGSQCAGSGSGCERDGGADRTGDMRTSLGSGQLEAERAVRFPDVEPARAGEQLVAGGHEVGGVGEAAGDG